MGRSRPPPGTTPGYPDAVLGPKDRTGIVTTGVVICSAPTHPTVAPEITAVHGWW
jgi:hypothetical protein